MLRNAYSDAKIGFDTEENEPPKVWDEIFIIHYSAPAGLASQLARRRNFAAGPRRPAGP